MQQTSEQRSATFASALSAAAAEVLGLETDEVAISLPDGVGDRPVQVTLRVREVAEEPLAEGPATGVDEADQVDEDQADEGEDGAESGAVQPERDQDAADSSGETEGEHTDGGAGRPWVSEEELDAEADAAADFLEGLLDALDLPGDLRIHVHADHAELELVDIGTGALIGRRGQTLEAIQELVRCVLQREFQRRSRVKIDAEGYRARRLEKLIEKADEAIDQVLETGEPERLEPMDVFERKAVHHLVAGVDGVESRSQGREPARRIIIEPS